MRWHGDRLVSGRATYSVSIPKRVSDALARDWIPWGRSDRIRFNP